MYMFFNPPHTPVLKARHPVSYSFIKFVSLDGGFLGFLSVLHVFASVLYAYT